MRQTELWRQWEDVRLAFLLKTEPIESIEIGERFLVEISKYKSIKDLGPADIGSEVFVWFTDSPSAHGHLQMRAKLLSKRTGQIPQKGDPEKSVDSYTLELEKLSCVKRERCLSTDDLTAFRNDPITSPMFDLGRFPQRPEWKDHPDHRKHRFDFGRRDSRESTCFAVYLVKGTKIRRSPTATRWVTRGRADRKFKEVNNRNSNVFVRFE